MYFASNFWTYSISDLWLKTHMNWNNIELKYKLKSAELLFHLSIIFWFRQDNRSVNTVSFPPPQTTGTWTDAQIIKIL